MSQRWLRPLLAVACAGLTNAQAQPPAALPESVDLPAVLRLVREVSPRLTLERQAVAGAEANLISAGVLPNPRLTYGRFGQTSGQATLFEGSRQEVGSIELPLLIAGQRAARVDKAERDLESARARVATGASSLAAEASSAYVALLAAQEKAGLYTAASDELVRLRDIVAGRLASGMASRYDLLRIEVELTTLRSKLDLARADVADRSGNLAALLGLQDWRPRAAGSLNPLPLAAGALEGARARAPESPAVALANREQEAARSGVELAHRERWPVPSVTAGRSWTSDPFGAANYLGLSVELPIFDSKRGQLDKAEADAKAATLRRELALAETSATLERYAAVIAARQAALQGFERDAAARLEALGSMAEDAYRLGRATLFELLDSTRSRQELRQTRVDLVAGVLEAQVRFLATRGDLDRSVGTGGPAGR